MLNRDRPVLSGMGTAIGHISAIAIIDYALRVERLSDRSEIDRTVRMVQAIDAEYVAIENKGRDKP